MTTLLHPRITPQTRYRNINLFSIDYAFRPRLRARLTLGGLPCPGNLGLSAGRFFTCFTLLMSAYALVVPPACLTTHLRRLLQCSPTTTYRVRSFGATLEPRYIFRAGALDQ